MMHPRSSLLGTQEAVHGIEAEIRAAREKLRELERRLEAVKNKHRERIAQALRSKDPVERTMAEGVAAWWGVPPVSTSSRTK